MLNTAKEIDKYSREVSQSYEYLEHERKALEDKVKDGILTQEQANIQYANALNTLKKLQRETAQDLRSKLNAALGTEIRKIHNNYETVKQDNKAELDLLALAGNAEELERAVEKYKDNPLALLRLQQISKEKDMPLPIDVYPKERRLVEYSRKVEFLIDSIAGRKGETSEGLAKIKFIENHNEAQKAYNSYKYPSEITG